MVNSTPSDKPSSDSRPHSKPAAGWLPPSPEELQQELPQYKITQMLGRGGMGAVYMGRQTSLDRAVAIKILSGALEESDAGFSERFKNEARAMAKLNHPGIVSVYDFGQTSSGLLYIVMEYVDGTDVSKMIVAKSRLHSDHAIAITAHVCDALSYAHERGIIHRDIKPANIMVAYDGSVKVADFGLAKVSTSNGSTMGLTQSGMALGTLHYMAPEALILGTSVDHRADIYAVGVMLYQMLTGKLPQGMFRMPSQIVPGIDPRYDGVIAKAIMEDRDERYPDVRTMRAALDAVVTQPVVKVDEQSKAAPAALPTQARPQRPGAASLPPSRPPPRREFSPPAARRRAGFPWAAVFWLLLIASGAAWWLRENMNFVRTSVEATSPAGASSPSLTPAGSTGTGKSEASAASPSSAPASSNSATTQTASAGSSSAPPPVKIVQPVFTNSLGMQFVPLGESKHLVCVHETRRKDYQAYASNRGGVNREWEAPFHDGVALPQEPEHPVTMVSWEDASAFTAWLSSSERRSYRLITTEEWSLLSDAEDYYRPGYVRPEKPIFPWGTAWPPPLTCGNLAGAEFAKQWPGQRTISSFRDGFAATAPVKSFQPIPAGVYDLAGNVREICRDLDTWSKTSAFVRGSSFKDAMTGDLKSSNSENRQKTNRLPYMGFRIVLENGGVVFAPAPEPAPAAAGNTKPQNASPSIWVDAKNRTLNATFVRMEGSNVVLLVSGRATPVPLASLSSSSQQMAAKLARQQISESLKWLFGVWSVMEQGRETLYDPAAFLSDGSAVRSVPSAALQRGSWEVVGEVFKVAWADQTRWELPIPGLLRPTSFGGQASQGTDPPKTFLLARRSSTAVLPGKAPEAADLAGKYFTFRWRASGDGASHGDLRFEKDGHISLSRSDNEHTWELRDGFLVFRNREGLPTTVFDTFEKARGRWSFSGTFLGVRNVQHLLEQK